MTVPLGHSMLAGFLTFLLAIPVVAAVPQTTNDQFRALALHRPKEPEAPVCCLRPLPSVEPEQDDDLLLSFEDWKAKRLAVHENASSATAGKDGQPRPDSGRTGGEPTGDRASDFQSSGDSTYAADDSAHAQYGEPGAHSSLPPHFRVPLTDRFNFAAVDCSARVHASHSAAKSASAILSAKKDRYMLAPCGARGMHVVVELCDDIKIDTVQLANFEFFSGVFRDLSISVAKTYTKDPRGWIDAGVYRAKNVRGVQVGSLLSFLRYSTVLTRWCIVIPSTDVPTRLLPVHPDRYPLALRK